MNTTILNDNLNERDLSAALAKKGMDSTVSKRPLYDANGRELPIWGIFDDTTEQFHGGVGAIYKAVQIDRVLSPLQDIVNAAPDAKFDNIGTLDGGRKYYGQVNIADPFDVVPGDKHSTFFTALGSHDGSSALMLLLTFIRIICQNTFAMAKAAAKAAGTAFSIRHTETAEEKLIDAGAKLAAAHRVNKSLKEMLQELAARKLDKLTVMKILERRFPSSKEDVVDTQTENKRLAFLELFERNDGDAFPTIRGTAYNAWNALTEYEDHYAPVRKSEGKKLVSEMLLRQERGIFGTGLQTKQEGLEYIMEITKDAPRIVQPSTLYSVASVAAPIMPPPPPSQGGLLDSILAQYN